MNDTISRKAVLDYIDKMPSELTADGRRMIRRIRLTEYIQDSLPSVYTDEEIQKMQDLESAEIEKAYQLGYGEGKKGAQPERKTGKWIFGHTLGQSWMKCSECLVSQDGQTACFSYCPNCGAKMEAET